MALRRGINPSSKQTNDTGFGSNASSYGGRFINRDGTFNLKKVGLPLADRFSIYHTMLNLPAWKFAVLLLAFYFVANLVFACIYLLIGMHQFTGLVGNSPWRRFVEMFFFSTETFTTVGYGRVNPVGSMANLVAAVEALSGFASFAVLTGLIYGRFSKPKSFLVFSDFAVIAPYQNKMALMFRFAPYKDYHTLTNVEIKVTIGLKVFENDDMVYRYYELALERSRVDSLAMNWTVVHPIDENSPMLGFNEDDMKAADVELYVLVRGFDDVYSNFVQQRTSYTYEEIQFNRKFIPMYRESEDGKTTILELHKLNEYVLIETALPAKKAPDHVSSNPVREV